MHKMEIKGYTAAFKTKVELLRGELELNEIAADHHIAPNQLRNCKAEFLSNAELAFDRKRNRCLQEELRAKQREADALAKKVGQQAIAIDYLKKTLETK